MTYVVQLKGVEKMLTAMEILLYIVFGIVVAYLLMKPKQLKGKIIPCPGGLPFIGCALEVTQSNFHLKLSEYAEQFGDIVRLNMFGKDLISLNSEELIRKAGCDDPYKQYFNDRAESFLGKYIFYDSQSAGMFKDGFDHTHNELRKGIVAAMHIYGEGTPVFEAKVGSEIKNVMTKIEQHEGKEFEFTELMKRSLARLVSILLSGDTLSDDDVDADMFWEFDRAADYFFTPRVNAILLAFPFLRHLPGVYRNEYLAIVKAKNKIIKRYLEDVKKTHSTGNVRGIIDSLIDKQKSDIENGRDILFTDNRIACVILETIEASILTSLSAVSSLLLCLLNNPEYQKKIQKELDAVIGHGNSPTIQDRQNCPFFEACVLESMRYVPPVPLILPHFCEPHVAFEGYDVRPKSLIIPNAFFIHHDEKIWGDPWNYRPERFLDDKGELLPRSHYLRKSWLPFGVGRRRCLGESLARSRMFLYVTSLLQRWTLIPSEDKCGSCDPRSDQFTYKFMCIPNAFHFRVEERK